MTNLSGEFKKIIFRPLGSQTQSDEAMKILKGQLSQCGEDPVLLVLDDVWPLSEDIVEINTNLRSPASRNLVTSRAQMINVGARRLMKLLSDQDAENFSVT
ncbi:hypothetical protein K1719_019604 [Acacia pycnantha]|nr:hypothetical protein K1719_019604 [Acacia pycnantha]